ncbi:hypothetical protein [Croceitalea rosinachiae]|uniref:FRG domain-containing protein n=1 Tax=Croceitalea rosinachiae TaxID=3075596 RepID=A0ABU3A9I7_9FLAO|nr:hypothetical protein [Croceitalea sp. F388]MDT0606850.1 hypothetical protein [Croceitalea sp. F388]
MSIEIDSCVNASSRNYVSFIIENPTDSDLWIQTYFLTFYRGVYSQDGKMVSRKSTRHSNILDIGEEEYTKIDKNSTRIIKWKADFFENLQFELNKEYYLECGYQPPHLGRKEKRKLKKLNIELLENQFNGKSDLFRICKL